MTKTTWGPRQRGTGVPEVPWEVTPYAGYLADYEGQAFIIADPKGMAREVCAGFIDDMAWIAKLHNGMLGSGWRARLARRLLKIHEVTR